MLTQAAPPWPDPALWQALVEDAGVGFKILDADGAMLYANAVYAELIGAPSVASLLGRVPHDYLPASFADEILAMIRAVIRTGKPAMIRTMWHGRPVTGLVRPMDGGSRRAVACTVRPELASDRRLRNHGGMTFIQSRFADEGPIASLSVRERAVLSLIGTGMSTAQIAKTLGRSVKTIENQRNSLGHKLNVSNRVELARIALASGLSPTVQVGRRRVARRAPRM